MRRLTLAASAALSFSVSLVARAQSPAPNGPEIPANYFSTVFRTWSLTAAPGSCVDQGKPCFSGFAAWGQRAGTSDALGYRLLVGLQSTNPPDHLALGDSYGQFTHNGMMDYFQTHGGYGASYGVNASGPWSVEVADGGQFPYYYVGGTSPYVFDLTHVGAEYYFYDAGGATTSDASLTATVTPEPTTLALTLGGLAVLGASVRRRRRA